MIAALSNRLQQVGLAALLIAFALLVIGADRRLILLALLVSVLTSSRYAWSQIHVHGKHETQSLLKLTVVPLLVCAVAIVLVVWKFEMLVSGHG